MTKRAHPLMVSTLLAAGLLAQGCAPSQLAQGHPRGDDTESTPGKKPSVTGGDPVQESEDPADDPAPTGDPVDTNWIDPGPAVGQVCYDQGATCLPVFAPSALPDGYDYADRTGQYRPPEAWLDLDTADPLAWVADNFQLGELAQAAKGQLGVVQPHAVVRLQQVRDSVGPLRVNSGYRSPAWNAYVGGVSSSRHMYGDAFDLAPLSSTLDDLEDACRARGASYVGVYVSHIHCDWRDDPLEEAFYGADRRAASEVPAPELAAWIQVEDEGLVAPAEGFDEGEPLREWAAFDARGEVVARATGERFVPPENAVIVGVEIGRSLWVERALR